MESQNKNTIPEQQSPLSSAVPLTVQAINFILRIFVQVEKSGANYACLEPDQGGLKISLCNGRTNTAGEKQTSTPISTKSIAVPLAFIRQLYSSVNQRSFCWPDKDDKFFVTNPKRTRRLLFSPLNGNRILTDVQFQQNSSAIEKSLVFDNIIRTDIPPLFEQLSLSPTNREFIERSSIQPHGLILTSSLTTFHFIEASAIMLALRPDALCFPEITTLIAAEEVLTLAKDHLVIASLAADDPVQMIFDFQTLLKSQTDLLNQFQSSLLLSFIRKTIRRSCTGCARSTSIDPLTTEKLPVALRPSKKQTYMFGRGCEQCGHSAYHGTLGIESITEINVSLRSLLSSLPSISQVTELSYRHGTRSLLEDGLTKIYSGLTSFESVLSVINTASPAFLSAISSQRSSLGSGEYETPRDLEVQSRLDAESGGLFRMDKAASEPCKSKKHCLLIVEDDKDQRGVLELVFQNAGYDTVEAANGKEALQALTDKQVDLIVCDFMMPGLNGEDLIKHIRANPTITHTPVIVLTAVSSPDTECNMLAIGADDYCTKDVKRKVLLKRVERLLARKERNPVQHFLAE